MRNKLFFFMSAIMIIIAYSVYLLSTIYSVILLLTFFGISIFSKRFEGFRLYPKKTRYIIFGLLILSLIIISFSGIFDITNFPITSDYPHHYYYSWVTSRYLLPNYQNVLGFVPFFQAGYIELYDYSPALPVLVSIMSTLFALNFSFRILTLLSFIFPVFMIYILTIKVTGRNYCGLISSLVWLGNIHHQFECGATSNYIAISLSLLSVYYMLSFLESKKDKHFYASSLFLVISFLFHAKIGAFSILPLALILAFNAKRPRHLFALLLILLFSSSIYIAQVYHALYQKEYGNIVTSEQENLSSVDLFVSLFLNYFPVFFICPLAFFRANTEENKRILFLTTPFILIAISFVITSIEPLNIFVSLLRVLFAYHTTLLYSTALLAVVFPIALENLTKNIDMPDLKYFADALWMSVLFYSIIFLVITWSNPGHSLYQETMGITAQSAYGTDFYSGIFSYSPNPDIIEVFEWLNNTAYFNERVILENDFGYDKNMRIFSAAPILINKFFIGGSSSSSVVINKRNYEVVDGMAFGKDIKAYSYDEFTEKLDSLNVIYLVVWTEDFKEFLNSSDYFEKVFESRNHMFDIYKYKNCPSSYVIGDVNGTFYFDWINRMRLVLDNVSSGEEITLSLTYFPEFHSYVYLQNRTVLHPELYMDNDTGFLSLRAPISGSYTVDIVYESSTMDIISRNITVLTLFLLIIKLISKSRLFK